MIFGVGCAVASGIIAVIAGLLKARVVALIGITFIMVLSLLIVAFYTVALNRIFADTDSWLSFIKFKHATELIKKSAQYNKAFLLFILINVLCGIISGTLFAIWGRTIEGLIIVTIISSIIASYVAFINAFITAKAID